jgi:uridine phosphorylase
MLTEEQVVEKIKEQVISVDEAKELARSTEYRLSDAIREGAQVTLHAIGWGAGEQACALSAAALAAKARGLI